VPARALPAPGHPSRTLAALLVVALAASAARAQPRRLPPLPAPSPPAAELPVPAVPLPFANGESLVYELSWLGIVGGTAELRVDPPADHEGVLAYRITSRARSNEFFSKIYTVDDLVESVVAAQPFRALRYEKHLREGGKQREELVRFDPVRNVAEEKGRTVATPPFVLDALSALYFVRTMDLAVGNSLQVPVHANGRNYALTVDVLSRERVRTPFGERMAWKVEPHQQYEGVFAKKGRLWVWISDDPTRLPLLMKSSLSIGSIAARLVEYRVSSGVAVGAAPSASPRPGN
jgi:hypothetical protein